MDLPGDAHQIADHCDAGGMRAGAAAVIESIRAVVAAHPHGVVGSTDARENRGLRDQRRPHGKNEPFTVIHGASDQRKQPTEVALPVIYELFLKIKEERATQIKGGEGMRFAPGTQLSVAPFPSHQPL